MTTLVRDKTPEIFLDQGKRVDMRVATGREYEFMLLSKLDEQVKEFLRSRTAEDIADILELLRCIADVKDIKWEEVEAMRARKSLEKGSFHKKLIIESVE